ncbi:hypothetical protein T484DRAFT_1839490 [Baffinella frigidus]|nr:hypothetical protein T484DRAFT_1839490 [Cryptophyta sp. CCMP2293]
MSVLNTSAARTQVFDKRESFGVGDPNGVGGVIKSEGKKGKNKKVDPDVLGQCCVCDAPWERYVGKKKCFACGAPVLMCEKCLQLKLDTGTKEQQLSVRCPLCFEKPELLCFEDGRTEAATEAELIENGMLAKGTEKAGAGTGTVLKWGGGHGKKHAQGYGQNAKVLTSEVLLYLRGGTALETKRRPRAGAAAIKV